jgi:pimeloyl-ACP methyl ester carboxylesterase
MHKLIKFVTSTAVALGIATSGSAQTAPVATPQASPAVFYRSVSIDGVSIFYREAGRPDAPTLLLLHGFPSSSRMFEPLLTRLSAHYHLVAPDYPGFGHSDAPGSKEFSYTFDHISQVIQRFTEALGLRHYVLYMQDYGGPVGFRLAVTHPERVQGFIIQNAVAHEDGLSPLFVVAETAAYQRDLPKAEVHILDAGHFALYDKPNEIAGLVSDFLRHTLGGQAAVK